MKKVVFLVVALFVNSSSVIGIRQRLPGIGFAIANDTSYMLSVDFGWANYDVFVKGCKILEPIALGPHDLDTFLVIVPKKAEEIGNQPTAEAERIRDRPDKASFSISRRRPWWPFTRETLNFQVVLTNSPNGYEMFLRGEDGQNVTQLSTPPFTAECSRGQLDGWSDLFMLDVTQRETIDGKIKDKFAQRCHCF